MASASAIPIDHVFIIFKENHTYDNYFGNFPGGNGVMQATDSKGNTIPLLQYFTEIDYPGTNAWAGAHATDPELSALSRAFLIREKSFQCCELRELTIDKTLRLSVGLSKAGREGVDWLLDDPKFTSYKDFDSGFRGNTKKPDNAAVSTSAILISDGELGSIARPAELASVVLGALGDNPKGNKTTLARLYYHKKIAAEVEKVLESVGQKTT